MQEIRLPSYFPALYTQISYSLRRINNSALITPSNITHTTRNVDANLRLYKEFVLYDYFYVFSYIFTVNIHRLHWHFFVNFILI